LKKHLTYGNKTKTTNAFTITNNLLAPTIRATNLRITPQAIAYNNSKNFKDGASSMKHLEKCSYTIPKNPPENKWGIVAKVWANTVLFKTKMFSS
jgi:hypothetical protein